MTIASAFNEIAVAQGGTAAKSGAITAAIDALNDALAGSDQPQAKTIEQAVRLLGEHIGGGGASIGSLRTVPFFYTGTIAEGASMEGEPMPIALITLMIGDFPLIAPNLGEWSQSLGTALQVAEGVKMVIQDETDGTMDGIYAMTIDQQTGKMTNVRKVDCGEDFIEYDNLSCISLDIPQTTADEYMLIHYPAGE